MIYLDLFIGFLKVGLFSFGGAYGAIPLIRDVVMSYGWMDEETLVDMIAISESTPGPIMVNLATYIGTSKAGFLGAMLATLAVVLPSFVITLLVMSLLKKAIKNNYVQAMIKGLQPSIIGIILATGCYMIFKNISDAIMQNSRDFGAILLTVVLFAIYFGSGKVMKKQISPIVLLLISAVLGVLIYGV